jgi:hypothetical protein
MTNKSKLYVLTSICSSCFFCLIAFTTLAQEPSLIDLRKKVENLEVYDILILANDASLTNYVQALSYADLAFEKAKKTGVGKDLYDATIIKGFIHEDNNNLEQALNGYLDARKIAETVGVEQILDASNNIAILYGKLGKYTLSKQFHEETLELAKQTNNLKFQDYSYNGLGTFYELTGEYDLAVEYYLQSLALSEQKKATKDIILSYQNIANAYTKAKQLDNALSSIEKAYQLSLTLNAEDNKEDIKANILCCYGKIVVEQGNLDLGLKKQMEALHIFEKDNKRTDLINVLISIADIYALKKEYSTSEQCFLRCFLYKEQMNGRNEVKLYSKLGGLYFETNRLNEAKKMLLDCLTKLKSVEYKEVEQTTHYTLYQIYKKQHNQTLALQHFEAYLTLNESLYSMQKTQRIAALQYKFDSEKSYKELQGLAVRESNFRLVSSGICVLILVLFIGIVVYWRGQNTRLLQQKKQEIEAHNKMLSEANVLLNQFAYAAAHDLKEPLRNIGSFASLLKRRYGKNFNEEANEYMTFISVGIRRMTGLLEDLMHYSTEISKKEHGEIY